MYFYDLNCFTVSDTLYGNMSHLLLSRNQSTAKGSLELITIFANWLIIIIRCLISRMTVTSARIPKLWLQCNLCVFSHVQKGTQGLMHKGCILECLPSGALSDFMVVLEMRQSVALYLYGTYIHPQDQHGMLAMRGQVARHHITC